MPEKSNQRVRGVVINFLPRKGFGFLQSERGEKVFVHYSNIKGKDYRTLVTGEEVEFLIIEDERGLQAREVVRLKPTQSQQGKVESVNSGRTW